MFKVTIIRLRDIFKIAFILILIYVSSQMILKNVSIKNCLNQMVILNPETITKLGINTSSNIIKYISNEELKKEEIEKVSWVKSILNLEMSAFNVKESDTELGQDEDFKIEEKIAESNDIITNSETEVVTKNPIVESYNREYNGVKIKNETSYDLTEEILNSKNLNINTNKIIIFHTHTCESYTPNENSNYISTGNYRTTDLNYSVARVGDELTSYLEQGGFSVNHNKTIHDYPSYTGSYNRSLRSVQNILQNFDSDIIIDLHRDAIGSDETYAPTVKIGDDYCAQLMFVIGTDGGGMSHPNWNSNLKFALKIQEKANELYPNLFKPIILRNSRYNQHLGKAACIIEVGATGNTLEQTLNSMKYLSFVIKETF